MGMKKRYADIIKIFAILLVALNTVGLKVFGKSFTLGFFVLAFSFAISETYVISEKKDIKDIVKRTINSYLSFFSQVAVSLLACITISYMLLIPKNAETVWGETIIEKIGGTISNALGISRFLGMNWYSKGWEALTYFLIFIIVVPFVIIINSKLKPYITFALSVVVLGALKLLNVISLHMTGMLAALSLGACVVALFSPKMDENSEESNGASDSIIGKFDFLIPVYMLQAFAKYFVLEKFECGSRVLEYVFILVFAVAIYLIIEIFKNINKFEKIDKLWNKKYSSIILAFATVLICYMISICTSEMAYVNTDDGSIEYTLAGFSVGKPFGSHQYINIILGRFISGLYKICPQVQWWYVYSQLLIAVGMLLIHYAIFENGKKHNHKIGLPLLLVTILDFGFLIYSASNVSFTTAPAILGTGIAMMLFVNAKKERKTLIPLLCLVWIGFVVIYIHRDFVGIAMLCYIGMGLIYTYIKSPKKYSIKKIIIMSVVSFAIMMATIVGLNKINAAANTKINDQEFNKFNVARIAYKDYSHDEFDDNPELFAKVGWDRNIYNLVEKWCFLPEEVNAETLHYLSQNSNHQSLDSEDLNEKIFSVSRAVSILMLGLIGVIILLLSALNKKKIWDFLFVLANNLGSIILVLYQVFNGRILYRTVFVVMLPMLAIDFWFYEKYAAKEEKRKTILKYVSLIAALFSIVISLEYNFDIERKNNLKGYRAGETAVNEYVMSHRDNLFINTVSVARNMGPWNNYVDEKPTNIICWGSAMYLSGHYKEQLRVNGIDKMSAEVFTRDNVNLVISTNIKKGKTLGPDNIFGSLYRYLKNKYNAVGFVKVDTIEPEYGKNVYVYHFIFEDDMHNYKKYMDLKNDVVKIVKCK